MPMRQTVTLCISSALAALCGSACGPDATSVGAAATADAGGGSSATSDTTLSETTEGEGTGDTAGGGYRPVECLGELVAHDGDLIISEDTDPQTVVCIREVGGELQIRETTSWTDLQPLHNLASVRFGLSVVANQALANLRGLEGLLEVNDLEIARNPRLTSVTALQMLGPGSVSFSIVDNDALVDLKGLRGTVASLTIADNGSLATLAGLQVGFYPLKGGALTITNNDALVDLQGLDLDTNDNIYQEIAVLDNDALESLAGTEALRLSAPPMDYKLGGSKLRDLATLQGITSAYHVWISGPSLPDLADLSDLEAIHGRLVIADTRSVADLRDLAALTLVPDLQIGDCISEYDEETQTRSVTWHPNDGIMSLDGLEALGYQEPGRPWPAILKLVLNPKLTDIEALRRDGGLSDVYALGNTSLSDITMEDVFTGPRFAFTGCGNLDSDRPIDDECTLDTCTDPDPPPE
jgi:hypothetical protein